MKYCAPPEDKWLLVDLLNSTTSNCLFVVINLILNATYS